VKKLLLLVVLLCTTAQAQMPLENPKQVIFLGTIWDHPENQFAGMVGGGTKLVNGLWAFYSGKFGTTGAFEPDLAYLVQPIGGLTLGLIAGPHIEWVPDNLSDMDPVAYAVAATGAILGYHWEKVGVYGAGKYKFGPANSAFADGWRVGVFLAYNP
jgi:hypothetical protein